MLFLRSDLPWESIAEMVNVVHVFVRPRFSRIAYPCTLDASAGSRCSSTLRRWKRSAGHGREHAKDRDANDGALSQFKAENACVGVGKVLDGNLELGQEKTGLDKPLRRSIGYISGLTQPHSLMCAIIKQDWMVALLID
jgi:hypothetical protein